jgi:hypothetical protein
MKPLSTWGYAAKPFLNWLKRGESHSNEPGANTSSSKRMLSAVFDRAVYRIRWKRPGGSIGAEPMNREIDNMVYRRTDPTEPIEILYNALLDFDEEEFAASPLPERKSIFPTATGGKGGRACQGTELRAKIIKTKQKLTELCRDYIGYTDPIF